jgi:hypothetical protein
MARKRKKHTTRRRKRSGMGAVGTSATTILSVVAGAVAGKFIQSRLSSKVNPKILAGGQIVAGIFLPKLVKNEFMKGVGVGMIANGGVTALGEFGVLAGIGADDMSVEYIGGSEDIATIAGDDEIGYDGSDSIQTIAGVDDEIGAFEDEMYN